VRLTQAQEQNLLSRGVSRRSFGQIASLLTAGVSSLPLFSEMAYAQAAKLDNVPADAVMINANENPMGPCKEGLEALYKIAQIGGRYRYDLIDTLQKTLAEQEGVKNDYVRITYGSSPPLHQSTLAFTSPTRSLVMADPSYESAAGASKIVGAKVIRVPLTKDYQHDVRAMAAADPNAGLIYIVNPNNPTGTLTPKADIEWLVANKPKGAIVMIDEAYTHISGAPFNSDLVAADKDVIILRTFSKIYGMAGLRAGAIIARPDLIEKQGTFSSTGMQATTAMACAIESLKSKTLVPERRKIIADIRNDTFDYLAKNNFHYVPSVSNCFMVDVKRPAMDTVMALRKEKIYIGRVWPAWPTHVRVTVGTQDEMNKFKTAFSKVMAA
jgi:histidinol-phosphate/aromatic aminotransferase/cobyric acid decarboxylase-like protein